MSLLSVTVKKARYVGIQATQFNTYVTLKLQNVKSTTVTVKGPTPSWEQDFLFEINDINLGLLVEVWNKGVIWDRALGYHYLPLTSVAYNEECGGRWVELEAQLMMRGGAVVGTTGPTGHALLLDCRFEPPFDAEGTGGADLQRKLDLLNGALDAERAEQARRQMQYIAHSGYSEDSDYTSDLNFPLGQHANCSASQFRNAAHQMHTPQRSLEVSRENSYERDEYHIHGDTDPLYYNSQPRTNRIDTWSQLHAQQSVESAISWRTANDWQSGEEQRRPSLERQNTLYDDSVGYSYDAYTNSMHTRDHSHLPQQTSFEEYYDSTSYPYQTSYVGDDSRQWDSGGRYFYDDGYGLTPTEHENVTNNRRNSIVQLPQVPPKQLPPSSRYSDCNEMAPYRFRQRRTTASLPATPSSTPKRGRALPVPPGSESGSVRGSRGRRLPHLPYVPPAAATTQTHVPYVSEPETTVPKTSYGYDSFGFQSEYQATATDPYQSENNYNTSSYGEQPFFDETPHATPPAAAQKPSWSDTENQFSYSVQNEEDKLLSKTMPLTISSYTPQTPVTTQQDTSYRETSYQTDPNFDTSYQDTILQQNYQQGSNFPQDTSYQNEKDTNYLETSYKPDTSYQEDSYHQDSSYQDTAVSQQDTSYQQDSNYQDYQQNDTQYADQQYSLYEKQELPYQDQYQDQTDFQQQSFDYQFQGDQKHPPYQQEQHYTQEQYQQQDQQFQEQQLKLQQQQLQQHHQQQQQHQQQKQTAQQLQTTVLTGAATLGSLMAGGAKKLGSFFGAAAASIATPTVSQTHLQSATNTTPVSHYTHTIAPTTPFSSTITVPVASVPEILPSVPASTATVTSVSLPRTPSLKRQESIQRPSVRRTRTLPDAPEDLPPSSYESAYEDDYDKTETDQLIDRDRTSLDRYRDDEYLHETILEEPGEEAHMQGETSPGVQKTSPTRTVIQARKPSVDSYHSQAPSIVDRKSSQSSFHQVDVHVVPTTQEQELPEKTKVSFQDQRTTYHEVPEEDTFQDDQQYDEHGNEYQDDQQYGQNNTFQEQEKFENDEQFNESDEQYQDSVFQESERQKEPLEFQPEQPKLTPKQRWHRAYNKIVMQLNVSTFIF